jgi:hypothetical protein
MRYTSLRFVIAPAAVLALAATLTTGNAADRPVTKGPTETMGSEGKLPATNAAGSQVPDMTGPQSAATPAGSAEGNASGTSGKATNERMGDEGTLPATGTMGGAVPDMTTQHGTSK